MLKKAIIYWFSEEEGGKKILPQGTEYYPHIELEDGGICSMAIRLLDTVETTKNERITNCEVTFLFDHAPQHLLRSSAEIILCEGRQKVAAMVIR